MQVERQILAVSNALVVFNVAARCGSFTEAGKALGMAQASVSYFIKQLEQNLDMPLFHRYHRRVELTEAGKRFYYHVSGGLSEVEQGLLEVKQAGDTQQVTISSSTAFASYWLLPRLVGFRKRFADIDLRILTSDKDPNLVQESIALGVALSDGHFKDYDAELLAEEEILAICSPEFLKRYGIPDDVTQMIEYPLIHLDEPFRPRATWADWFASFGVKLVDKGDGLRLNDYALVIQAAIEGQGIALGWRHVSQQLIKSGVLVEVSQDCYRSGKAFYLIWPKSQALSEGARIVRDWIREQIAD